MIRRASLGAIAGALAWIALHPILLWFPEPLRFFAGWTLFTAGPGLLLGARLTRELARLERAVIVLGLGSAGVPIVVEICGRLGHLGAFPYLATVCAGAGLMLSRGSRAAANEKRHPTLFSDLGACASIVVIAIGLGCVVFAHRLVETPVGIRLYGDYDSFDLSHYASWASDAVHTVPPKAAFYSGHNLNAAYYPQLVLTMVHRFLGVDLLRIYFGYAWPLFLTLGGLTFYWLVRLLAPPGAALLAAVLLIIGGDFSYLAAWLLPHDTIQWDYVLWPTNFLSPTMEVLHFNTWGPSLPIFFLALYAIVRNVQNRSTRWLVAGALVTAVLFQFKPFAYIVTMLGLGCAFLFAGAEKGMRIRLMMTAIVTGAFTTPLLYDILTMRPEDQRSRLLLRFFVLPERMLLKLDLTDAYAQFAARFGGLQRPIFLLSATVLFLAVGLGVRWSGIPGVWRAIRGRAAEPRAAWKILAWIVAAGVLLPFFLATEPYVDTLQFYETGLYVLWIFAGVTLAAFASRHRIAGALAILIAIAASVPSSAHYLARKWHDSDREAIATLTQGDVRIAEYLRQQDAERTVILHDAPTSPSLLGILAERRVVLAWGRGYYAVGSEERAREIERFFRGQTGSPAMDTLRRYQVSHVVVHPDRDRVDAGVLAQLTPVMTFPDAALYEVPAK